MKIGKAQATVLSQKVTTVALHRLRRSQKNTQQVLQQQLELLAMNKARVLAEYIRAHTTFVVVESLDPDLHIGAILADAVLQRGINYNNVVKPRINRILCSYPYATTTSAFAQVIKEHGAARVLNWSGRQKPQTLVALVNLLLEDGVDTVDELRAWLERPGSLARLQRIKGVKNKTADYLQILAGIQAVAVDVHLFNFLTEAGVRTSNYAEARQILCETAQLLDVEAANLDHSIWLYGSSKVAPTGRICHRLIGAEQIAGSGGAG